MRTGKGALKQANGDVFKGNWIDGKRCGKGELKSANGKIIEGYWLNDEMIKDQASQGVDDKPCEINE